MTKTALSKLSGAALGAAYRGLGSGLASGALLLPRNPDRDERLARSEALADLPRHALWLHGASVGEVRALAPLAVELTRQRAGLALLVTSNTLAGRERARAELNLPAVLAPLDARRIAQRFIALLEPRAHIIVETELWPARLAALAAERVPAMLVSARLSLARWPRYRRLSGFYARCLDALALVAPASAGDRDRFLALGLDPTRLGPEENLKWDAAPWPANDDSRHALAAELGLGAGRLWLVFGSCHPGEALPVLDVLRGAVTSRVPLGIVLAPRHPERFEQEFAAIAARGWITHRASAGPAPPEADLVLLDRIGVLPRVYAVATAAMLGGTLVPVGGHTPLEAAAAGCPLVAGPFTDKQADLCAPLAAAGALVTVGDATAAAAALAHFARDRAARDAAGAAGTRETAQRRGSAARLATAILARIT